MEPTFLIGFAVAILAAVSLLTLALWRHKKSSAGEVKLIGEPGRVETKLDPEGTVIVAGELWRAISNDGALIGVNASVRVVGMKAHLVVVELSEPPGPLL
jgi:membrane-bound ClpP family serine protease